MTLRRWAPAVAVSLLVALGGLPALAQTQAVAPTAPPKNWKTPRNAFGQPDLQGIWTNATITNLERDARYGERLALTDPEAAALEGANAQVFDKLAQPTKADTKVDDLPACPSGSTGPTCGYNMFWVDPGTQVMRVKGQPRTSIITSPKSGRLPLTGEAQARARARQGNSQIGNFDGPERRPLAERCIVAFGSSSGPPMLPVLYNNHYQIVQSPNEVMILVEMVHDVRLIRLNDTHRPAAMKQWMGDSVGRWEGDTLVVETTNFRPEQAFRGATGALKVVERFTRVSPTEINYQFELVDPATFSEPVRGEEAWRAAKGPVHEYACHEGNYALPGILAGAREEERKGREMEGNRGVVREEGEGED
jgi:hypothetical protein